MKFTRIAVLLSVLISSLLAVPNADATLIPSPDGMTVYDTVLRVNWLANANLAGRPDTPEAQFLVAKVANITPGGAMDYATAVKLVDTLNKYGYLGHNNWQLPMTER